LIFEKALNLESAIGRVEVCNSELLSYKSGHCGIQVQNLFRFCGVGMSIQESSIGEILAQAYEENDEDKYWALIAELHLIRWDTEMQLVA
jgi:hypothetical protein